MNLKTFLRFFAGLLILGFLATSCNKDDDKNDSAGYLKIDGTQYSLATGLIENYGKAGDNDSCYLLRLNMVSSGIKVGTYPDGEFFPTGQGVYVILSMYSSHGESLDTGTYIYNLNIHVKTFSYSSYSLSWQGFGSILNHWIDFYQGTITVSRNGDIYKIIWNLVDVHGTTVSGYYQGKLSYFDYESLYK